VANPGQDSAAVILHNHHAFVLKLAARINVDLGPVPQPNLYSQPSSSRHNRDVEMEILDASSSHDAEAGTGTHDMTNHPPGDRDVEMEFLDAVSSQDTDRAHDITNLRPNTNRTTPAPRPSVPAAPIIPSKALIPSRTATRASRELSRGTSTSRPTGQIMTITMTLRPGTTVEDLARAMETFAREIEEASITVRTDNKEVHDVHLTSGEIQKIARFFFRDVFGPTAMDRLRDLLAYIQDAEDRGEELGSSERAAALAHQDDIPKAFRTFFAYFVSFHQGTRSNTTIYARTLTNWHRYKLYETFELLRRTALNDPSRYKDFLKKQGMVRGIGQGATTPILTYLSGALDMDRNRLTNVLQQSQSIYLLARTFGPGVLALAPSSASNT